MALELKNLKLVEKDGEVKVEMKVSDIFAMLGIKNFDDLVTKLRELLQTFPFLQPIVKNALQQIIDGAQGTETFLDDIAAKHFVALLLEVLGIPEE